MSGENLLVIDALTVSIGGRPVVDGVSLQVHAGEIVGLVGASGSGKSMTALAVTQLLPAQAQLRGTVQLRGTQLNGGSERTMRGVRGREVGIVFQEPMTALNPLMRIGDQVAETVLLHLPVSAARARQMARETLDAVGLPVEQCAMERFPHELSGGQRQRVAIAIAIVLRPSLLIADEPTTALDVTTQAQVLLLLRDLARHGRMGLLLISHDLAVIAQVTDRVAVMHDGRIVEESSSLELRRMRHPYARALLAAAEVAVRPAASPSAAPIVLEARNVTVEYPRGRRSSWRRATPLRAVDGVSLTVHAGETVGLVGESGSGKSSLLRALLALARPAGGEVRLLGESLTAARGAQLRGLRRSLQAVFQDPYGSFDPRWSVGRLVAEPFHLLDAPPTAAVRGMRVAAVLEQVGLVPADAGRYAHEFSGGQRQRIAIARALITEPAVIVFDEAVSALDVLVRAQILALLADLARRLQLACVFVSHDLNVVRSIADRVYVMQRGRIVEHGATAQVFGVPRHAYTRALVAATPHLPD